MFLVWNLKRKMKRALSNANINKKVNKLKKSFKETCYKYANGGCDFAVFIIYAPGCHEKIIIERFIAWVADQGFNVKLDDLNKDMIHVNWKDDIK